MRPVLLFVALTALALPALAQDAPDAVVPPDREKPSEIRAEQLDTLFAHRAASGGSMPYSDYQAIQQTVGQFINALTRRINEYTAGDYGRAKNFLDSLGNEAKMPAG